MTWQNDNERRFAAPSAASAESQVHRMIQGPGVRVSATSACSCACPFWRTSTSAAAEDGIEDARIDLPTPREIKAVLDRVCHRTGGCESGPVRGRIQPL